MIRCTAHYQPIGEPLHVHIRTDPFVVGYEAMKVNQMDLREAGSWMTKAEAISVLLKFLGYPADYADDVKYKESHAKFKLCGSNVAFDIGFLKKFLGHTMYARMFHYRGEEVTSAFQHLQRTGVIPPSQGMKLFQMAQALGVEFDDTKLHDALYDATVTCEIARELYRRSRVLEKAFALMCDHYNAAPPDIVKCFRSTNPEKRLKLLKQDHTKSTKSTKKKTKKGK
jgi:hypothetical protein